MYQRSNYRNCILPHRKYLPSKSREYYFGIECNARTRGNRRVKNTDRNVECAISRVIITDAKRSIALARADN